MPGRKSSNDKCAGGVDQHEKFKNAAHEHGCDDSEAAFDEIVRKITKAPPPRQDKKSKQKKPRK